jgi:hypothetical protein
MGSAVRTTRIRVTARRVAVLVLAQLLALTAAAAIRTPAWAGAKSSTVDFGTFESIARADNGDTVEVNGVGTFSLQPKSASGDGSLLTDAFGPVPRTFTHRDSVGNVRAEGTWEPTAVLSYQTYGPATAEQIAEFGGLPDGSEGGKVMLKIALFTDGVHAHDGILTIVCLLGVPPTHAQESTLLLVQGTEFNFNKVVEGDNLLIRH